MSAQHAPVAHGAPASPADGNRRAPQLAAGHALLAGCALATAARAPVSVAWLAAWVALSALLVAYAFAVNRPAVFKKCADGTLAPLSRLVLLPYLVVARCLFWLKLAARRREPCWHRVADRIYLGRVPRAFELPDDCERIIDLSAEFEASRAVVARGGYRCLPVLNRHVPSDAEFAALIDELRNCTGAIYVHCGAGRGRSAMVVAALLVARGLAADARDAERRLAAIRPGVRLHDEQRRIVDRYAIARTMTLDAAVR